MEKCGIGNVPQMLFFLMISVHETTTHLQVWESITVPEQI